MLKFLSTYQPTEFDKSICCRAALVALIPIGLLYLVRPHLFVTGWPFLFLTCLFIFGSIIAVFGATPTGSAE